MAYHEYYPEVMIELQKELRDYWPMISKEAMESNQDLPGQLGVIAARLGILLDGVYDIPDLCDMLLKKLRELRTTSIYLPNSEVGQKLIDVQIKEGANTVTIEQVPSPLPKKAD